MDGLLITVVAIFAFRGWLHYKEKDQTELASLCFIIGVASVFYIILKLVLWGA